MRPRILITRAPHQASALADSLRALGCDPILIPTIELAPPSTFAPLDAALARLHHFHWLIFTSANAVEAFHQRLTQHQAITPIKTLSDEDPSLLGESRGEIHSTDPSLIGGSRDEIHSPDPSLFGGSRGLQAPEIRPTERGALAPGLRIASIGPATSRAIEKLLGTKPSLVPPIAVTESLAATLLALTQNPQEAPLSKRFLFPRAEDSRNVLENAFKSTEINLTSVPVYRNIIPESSIPTIRELFTPGKYPDAITFTSSSTAINLLALLELSGISLPPEIPRISIGPITTQTLHDLHIPPTVESLEPTIHSLSAAVLKALAII